MVSIGEVSAVLVTRGDVDLTPILATLPYADVVIWDNSRRPRDLKCLGRFAGMLEARFDTVYLQDDDLLFTAHAELCALHERGRVTANMPSPWYERTGYDREGSVQLGAGSLLERGTPWGPLRRYLSRWDADELFLTYCDDVVGILAPSVRVDLGYEILPYASAPGRIYTRPGAHEARMLVAGRALELRGE